MLKHIPIEMFQDLVGTSDRRYRQTVESISDRLLGRHILTMACRGDKRPEVTVARVSAGAHRQVHNTINTEER